MDRNTKKGQRAALNKKTKNDTQLYNMFRNTLLWWKINVSRNVIPCKLVDGCQLFGETYRHALQGRRVWYKSTELYGLSYRKTVLFKVTAVNTSNIVKVLLLVFTLRPCSYSQRRWPCRSKYVE
jgi:hypothetical protein